ncbi:BTB/POZ domain-containing protein 19-like [Babylonia areolata]|uniref:BTB/POZ domain-containing protein 19-like n=1 Tax=Babylonia areolata TaxID=304850 RepID=UPI003FD52ABF
MPSGEKQMYGEAEEFAKQMKLLVNNKDLHDIQFVIGPARKKVYAHRCILSGRCEVFRAMFVDHTQKNGPIEKDTPFILSDMTPEVFLAMLEFIYTNTIVLNPNTAIDVMATALEYGLDDLKNLCEEYLVDSLNSSNACDRMQAAQTYRLDDLKRKTLEYIETNTQSVFDSKGFEELSEDTLCCILSSDCLMLDEMEIYTCVRRWASVNSVVSGKKIDQVATLAVTHLRLPLLTLEEVDQLEKDNKTDNLLPVESMALAWKLHATKQGDKGNPLFTRRKGTAPRDTHRYLDSSQS